MPHSDPPPDPPTATFLDLLEATLRPVDGWGTFRRGARHAAVNVILFHCAGRWRIPFVVRRPDLRSHPGQVGLPGGGVEAGESGFDAALRETEEEVGVPRAALRPLGAAPPVYAAVTNFAVATFVTYLSDPPASFTWDTSELVGVVSVALEELLDPDAWQLLGPYPGRQLATQDVVIWGLTERILAGVLPFLRQARNETRSATH